MNIWKFVNCRQNVILNKKLKCFFLVYMFLGGRNYFFWYKYMGLIDKCRDGRFRYMFFQDLVKFYEYWSYKFCIWFGVGYDKFLNQW